MTWNVVAEAGDRDGDRTLVVLAHHDARPDGPGLRPDPPARPGARGAGPVRQGEDLAAVCGGRSPERPPSARSAPRPGCAPSPPSAWRAPMFTTALGADIARSPVVPGANDNLSAVGGPRRSRRAAARGSRSAASRVLLASCGAEEVVQGGIYGSSARHFPTWIASARPFLNLDTVGRR